MILQCNFFYVFTPLIVAGGGGSSANPNKNNLTVTDASETHDGKASSVIGNGYGRGGVGGHGGQRGGGRVGAGTSGGGAGFMSNGVPSGDMRWGRTFSAIGFSQTGAFDEHKSGALGGRFNDAKKLEVNGGFGGGGSGGRWAAGGGGGYILFENNYTCNYEKLKILK